MCLVVCVSSCNVCDLDERPHTHSRLDSGRDLLQGLVLDRLVHKATDRLLRCHGGSQGSGEGSHVVHGVIVGATTSEGHGHGLILDADVLNGGGVGDCELHDKKSDGM